MLAVQVLPEGVVSQEVDFTLAVVLAVVAVAAEAVAKVGIN